jgi:hypothetical protein
MNFRFILLLLVFLVAAPASWAEPTLPPTTAHGILVDRVLPLAHLEELDGSPTAGITDLSRWRQTVHELARAAESDLGWPRPRRMQEAALMAAPAHRIPLAVVHARYDRMDESGGIASDEVFALAALRQDIFHGAQVTFLLDSPHFLTHLTDPIAALSFDPDDGGGSREIRLGEPLHASYRTTGIKNAVLTAKLADGKTLSATTIFSVKRLVTPTPHETWALTASESYEGNAGTGQAYIYLAPGHTALTNPAVVVEGFDLDNTMDWPVLYDLLNQENLLEDLRADGFDAVVLDFTESTEPIQRNAFVLTELLAQVNAAIAPERTTALVGASMGGLVARYALLWLEEQGITHRVRTFISFDAPQRGASVPLGLQHWLVFFQDESEEAGFLLSRFNTPAARQMVLYHHSATSGQTAGADPMFAAVQSEFVSLGDWPIQPRLIAVANGSGTGLNQGFTAGEQIVLYEYRSFLADIDGNVWAVPDGGTQVIFDGMINLVWPLPDTFQTVSVGGTLPWDNAPGGSRPSMAQMEMAQVPYGAIVALHDSHCFIPTVSALALAGVEPFHDIAGDPDLLSRTGFDLVYYPTENQEHIAITPQNKVWLMDEIRVGISAAEDLPGLAASGAVLYPAAPNPFNPRTEISFHLSSPGQVSLEIHDLAGRLVRTLVDHQDLQAGRHQAVWNGRTGDGRKAASGVYLCRLHAGDVVQTQRMTLVQ